MSRLLLTLSTFGFAAAAGVAALAIRPMPVAALAIGALGLAFAALTSLRDAEVRADALSPRSDRP